MAKDDYFVIAYKVLKYLYECLKRGKEPNMSILSADFFSIKTSYWAYIMESLKNEEYLIGVVVVDGVSVGIRPDITITPKGIQYLEENSLLQKAKETVKDIRDMLPI